MSYINRSPPYLIRIDHIIPTLDTHRVAYKDLYHYGDKMRKTGEHPNMPLYEHIHGLVCDGNATMVTSCVRKLATRRRYTKHLRYLLETAPNMENLGASILRRALLPTSDAYENRRADVLAIISAILPLCDAEPAKSAFSLLVADRRQMVDIITLAVEICPQITETLRRRDHQFGIDSCLPLRIAFAANNRRVLDWLLDSGTVNVNRDTFRVAYENTKEIFGVIYRFEHFRTKHRNTILLDTCPIEALLKHDRLDINIYSVATTPITLAIMLDNTSLGPLTNNPEMHYPEDVEDIRLILQHEKLDIQLLVLHTERPPNY